MIWVLAALTAAGLAAQGLRWARVLQREHYDARSLVRFVGRWWSPVLTPLGFLSPVVAAAVVALVVVGWGEPALLVAAVAAVLLPVGLSPRGRTGRLVYTRRCVVVITVAAVLAVAVMALARRSDVTALVVVAAPFWLAASAAILAPIEDRLAKRYIERARQRLVQVGPTVIGITGSYGKTSTKNHLLDVLAPTRGVVATPKSFNNRAGLSRAISENLVDGTTVFIAEMGTYGPGEISAMTAWCPPRISVITAIGPVHLERMKSLEVIERAKFEITKGAEIVVVNVDDERLHHWPAKLAPGTTVWTAGSVHEADVRVVRDGDEWVVTARGHTLRAPVTTSAQPTNVACALAAGLALGDDLDGLVARLANLRPVEHRSQAVRAASGVWVIDDTFNANPASAAASLALLRETPANGRRVVVTPGMVELGHLKREANAQLAATARADGAELVIVGRTNARALAAGYGEGARRVARRDQAVAWVRENLRDGDAVLYLNDLPDNYP